MFSSCNRLLLASTPSLKHMPIFRRTRAKKKNVSAGFGEKKKCGFCRSWEARIFEFRWFAGVSLDLRARNKRQCKAPRRRKQNTDAGYNRARREGGAKRIVRSLEIIVAPVSTRWKPVDSNYEIVHRVAWIVTRFHRQRDIRDTLSRATLSLGKVASRQCARLSNVRRIPCAARRPVFTRQILLHCRAQIQYIHTYMYIRRRIISFVWYIWHFYQLCHSLANLDACVRVVVRPD